jgi:hypothetical protein
MKEEKQDEIEHLRSLFVRPDKKPKLSLRNLIQNLAAALTPRRRERIVEPIKGKKNVKKNRDAA